MKKALICLVGIIAIILIGFGVKNIISGKRIENNTTYEKDNKNRFVEVETYKEKEDILYKYTLFNSKGKDVYEETGLYKEPNIEQLENGIIKIGVSAGSSVYQVRYFDSVKSRVSEIYSTPWDEKNNKLVRFENKKVIIQDIFDKSNYYQETELDMRDTADPNNAIKSAKFLDDSIVKVTYFSREDKEITKNINLDDSYSVNAEKLSVAGFSLEIPQISYLNNENKEKELNEILIDNVEKRLKRLSPGGKIHMFRYSIETKSETKLSILFTLDYYDGNAAHPYISAFAINLDLDKQEIIKLDEVKDRIRVFDKDTFSHVIKRDTSLVDDGGVLENKSTDELMADMDDNSFYFVKDKIGIIFEVPYACGGYSIYEEMGDVL